jgi:hypothetical protein
MADPPTRGGQVTSGVIALSFLSLQAALTPAGAFGLFAAIAV